MSFTMFMTWILVGVLAGLLADQVRKRGGYGLKADIALGVAGSIGVSWFLRAIGIFTGSGIAAAAIFALIGASLVIAGQRKLWATERPVEDKAPMWRWGFPAAIVVAVFWMTLGSTQQPAAIAAGTEDKAYTITPESMKVKVGIVTGEVTDMKVIERVEQGSGRVVAPAKLTARVTLKNSSTNQTIRLVAGKIRYSGADGKPIALEGSQTEPTIKFTSSGGDRLDPGQETTESLDVDFPAEALKAQKLKRIHLDLVYIPAPYREETVNFVVSVGGQ